MLKKINGSRRVVNCEEEQWQTDRLNALLLLFIHKDISLDCSAIVNIFPSHNQRRMHFINPLDDRNSWFYPDIVFKEHNFCLRNSKKRSSKCWKSHLWRSQFQNCATIPISVTGPLFLNILDPPLNRKVWNKISHWPATLNVSLINPNTFTTFIMVNKIVHYVFLLQKACEVITSPLLCKHIVWLQSFPSWCIVYQAVFKALQFSFGLPKLFSMLMLGENSTAPIKKVSKVIAWYYMFCFISWCSSPKNLHLRSLFHVQLRKKFRPV